VRWSLVPSPPDPDGGSSSSDAGVRRWVVVTTLVGYATFASAWHVAAPRATLPLAGAIVVHALAAAALAGRRPWTGLLGLALAWTVGLIGAAPIVGLIVATAAVACTGLAWSNARAAAWALALGPLTVLFALDGTGTALDARTMIALPAVILAATLGAARLQAALGRSHSKGTPAGSPAGGRGWLGNGLAALAWLALILPFGALLAGLSDALDFDGGSKEDGPSQDAGETGAAPTEPGERQRLEGRFPTSIRYSGRTDSIVPEAVLIARPVDSRRHDHEPLYLRGLVLDRFDDEGAQYDTARELTVARDADDGEDGWTTLRDAPEGTRGALELEIDQRNLHVDDSGASILFTPANTTALSLAEVHWNPNGRTVLPEPPAEGPTFVARYELRDVAGTDDPIYLQLPVGPNAERIRALAETIGGEHDVPRVIALQVAEHLRSDFDYALVSSEQPGLSGVLDFLERKRGHCTYFAAAATLLLRARGVPARVVTGFLASDWSDEDDGWVVTTKNGHAWVEALLDGRWERVDPTPADRRRAWLEGEQEHDERRFGEWLGDVAFDQALWVRTRGREPGLAALVSNLTSGPAALARSVGDVPRSVWIVALLLVAVAVAARWRRLPVAMGLHPRVPDESLRAEFVRTLTRSGPARRASQTLLELAHAARARNEALHEAPEHAVRLDRARWSGDELTPAERTTIRDWLRALPRQEAAG